MNGLRLDARWLDTGIGTYTANLMRALQQSGVDFGIITQRRHREAISPAITDVQFVDAGMYSIREQIEVPWAARRDSVLHVLHYNFPIARSAPTLVTIHDLTHILDKAHKNTLKSRLYARPMLCWASQSADHVFTGSEYSRRQIVDHLRVSPANITVAYYGVSAEFYPEPRDESRTSIGRALGFEGPYILFVGNLKPHKNVRNLVSAFGLLSARRRIAHKLLIVGKGEPERSELWGLTRKIGIAADVRFWSDLTLAQLRATYSGADLTVLPSFEEGFGLPVLESMACGTPVACSNVASLPEAGGNAASYFDPHDIESLASAILLLLDSAERWKTSQRLGFENIQRFTWQACARRHIDVYRRFIPASCFLN